MFCILFRFLKVVLCVGYGVLKGYVGAVFAAFAFMW